MNNQQPLTDDAVIRYITSMALSSRMLDESVITRHEFLAFEEKMRLKYGLSKHSLYRGFHLISPPL